MGKGKRGVVAREMGMEERRGEQEKGIGEVRRAE